MARELSSAQRVLVASQPTRGVDIGAAEYIHARLMAARDAGLAVLVISEDLDEVLALSDRVAVMFAGRIVGTLDRAACTTEPPRHDDGRRRRPRPPLIGVFAADGVSPVGFPGSKHSGSGKHSNGGRP